MSKFTADTAPDAYLTDARGDHVTVNTSPETVKATAESSALITQALAGSYTLADGPVDGRQQTVPEQTDTAVVASGNANWVHIWSGTTLQVRTAGDGQALVQGGTATINTWNQRVRDPA